MNRETFLFALALALATAACSDTLPVTAPERPRLSLECPALEQPDPNYPDCPVYDGSWGQSAMFDVVDVASSDPYASVASSAPVWQGETYITIPESQFVCPSTSPAFGLRGYHDATSRWYSATGYWTNIGGARPGTSPVPGLPHAFYRPPPGARVLSDDGQYEFTGDFVVACEGGFVMSSNGIPVWRGKLWSVGTRGTAKSVSGGGGGDGGGHGWAFSNSSINVQSGVGGAWQWVLEDFLTRGICTAGWEIWVDGTQRC